MKALPAAVKAHAMIGTGYPMFAVQVNVGDAPLCTSAFVGVVVICGATGGIKVTNRRFQS